MVDLRLTITPKSDQLNSDDLLCGPKTIKITEVRGMEGEQPIWIFFEGDESRPWKPCKSMRRILALAWDYEGDLYVGRSLTLFRDPEARFGNMKVGGIRISHMSHISEPLAVALTERKGVKKLFTVLPLPAEAAAKAAAPIVAVEPLKVAAKQAAARGLEDLKVWWEQISQAERAAIKPFMASIKENAAINVSETV